MGEEIIYKGGDLYEVRGGKNEGAYHANQLDIYTENPVFQKIIKLHRGSRGKQAPAKGKFQDGMITSLLKFFRIK